MSVDLLQEKIRRCKNPVMVELAMERRLIPEVYLQTHGSLPDAWGAYCRAIVEVLKETVPAVRFSLGSCALQGAEGLRALEELLVFSREQGYYVVLDAPELLSSSAAADLADMWKQRLCCDALVVSPWLGSDVLRPLASVCGEDKAVFAVVRSVNRSAYELQDLLSGSRHVHVAAMDLVNRHGETLIGKYGYSRMGALVGAASANVIKTLRGKYSRAFFLIDGIELSHGNFKNASLAFDKFGRGAIACAGSSVMAAWTEEGAPEDPVEAARQAVVRIKKNLTRYVTVL